MTPRLIVALVAGVGLACSTSPPPAETRAPTRPTGEVAPASPPAATPLAAPSPAAPAASAPDPPAPPVYDLARDLAAREADARGRLGKGSETTVVGGTFVLGGAPGFTGPALGSSRALVTRALDALYNDRLGARPREAITVYLFGDAERYGAFCKAATGAACISVYGFYLPGERWMVMNAGLGLGTLTHELVHPLIEADFPSAPTWLNEGIASLFEAPAFPRAGEIHGVKNWRLPRLKAALASGARDKAVPASLFGMSDDTFRDAEESLHYALARYVCQWLDERGKLWPFYRAFRDGYASDPTGAAAFTRVVGRAPGEERDAFVRWVARL